MTRLDNKHSCLKMRICLSYHRFRWYATNTRLWKTKHPRKRFQNFRQSCGLSTDRIEIHQLQPLVWPSDLLRVMLAGCDRWISIRSVDNVYDWRKFWKRFRGCFVFESRVSTKTVVTVFPWSSAQVRRMPTAIDILRQLIRSGPCLVKVATPRRQDYEESALLPL